MSTGENIKRLRIERGLTQCQLAELVGVTQQMINKIELNLRQPNISLARNIALALNCAIDDLVK